jgi:NACalpha-BTF3-like transcription factor
MPLRKKKRRSLNVLDTAAKLTNMRIRGIQDTEIRQDMGFKTGEVDKITSVMSLGADLQAALKAGAITPMVALSIAKLPANLQKELAADYETRKKDNANARISEADVTNIRQKRAAEAIKRDAPTLAGLADATPPIEETATPTPAPAVDPKGGKEVSSKPQAAPGKKTDKKGGVKS